MSPPNVPFTPLTCRCLGFLMQLRCVGLGCGWLCPPFCPFVYQLWLVSPRACLWSRVGFICLAALSAVSGFVGCGARSLGSSLLTTLVHLWNLCPGLGAGVHSPLSFVSHWSVVVYSWSLCFCLALVGRIRGLWFSSICLPNCHIACLLVCCSAGWVMMGGFHLIIYLLAFLCFRYSCSTFAHCHRCEDWYYGSGDQQSCRPPCSLKCLGTEHGRNLCHRRFWERLGNAAICKSCLRHGQCSEKDEGKNPEWNASWFWRVFMWNIYIICFQDLCLLC